MVAAYFKNIGQTRTLIQLLQDRSEIQRTAGMEMKEKFAHYNLELEEVLIGTPTANEDKHIEQILEQLRARQIAEEQVETYTRQQRASSQERELREAEARAKQQTFLTESEVSIAIQSNQGKADFERAKQQAAQIRALAEAEAEKTARIGIAQAMATEEQVRAYGGAQFQVLQQVIGRFSEAIEKSHVDIVPRVVIGGGSSDGTKSSQSNVFESLIALLLAEKAGVTINDQISPEAQELRSSIRADLQKGKH